jgi:Ferritin-like domain
MALNRITPGGAARRALLVLAASLAATTTIAACGGSGGETTTAVPDKAADVEVLNNVLTREMAAIRAYEVALPKLHGTDLANARRFRAQEQEHVDAIVKALRGLGGKAEPEEEEIEAAGLDSTGAVLDFLYAVEGVSIGSDLRAISNLSAPWPRSLLGSVAANQAQHLVLLRQALGADAAESVPKAFEDGTGLPPGDPPGTGAGSAAAGR